MLVNCRCCKQKIDRDVAYKVEIKGKNNYYCTEKEYRTMLENNRIKNDIYLVIYQIFGYKVMNTALYKEINDVLVAVDYSKLFNYLKENCDELIKNLSKDFNNEYGKIRYFGAIVKNNIKDYTIPIKQEPIKQIETDISEIKYKKKKRRKSLNEYNEDNDL